VLTRKRIRRGSFRSLVDLQAAIKRYLAHTTTKTQSRSSAPQRQPPSWPNSTGYLHHVFE